MKNANVDLCGIMVLLRKLRDASIQTEARMRWIAADIAVRNHADITVGYISINSSCLD